jgi:hypothetical protein
MQPMSMPKLAALLAAWVATGQPDWGQNSQRWAVLLTKALELPEARLLHLQH